MSPLSAIPATVSTHGLVPRPEITPSETQPGFRIDPQEWPGQSTGIAPATSAGESFGSLLGRMVQEVNTSQNAASAAVQNLQSGGNVSLHQAVIAMEEASLSFQLMVEVRNKLLESYQEIMRMQI
jgi:flagellar hook-basal body complex protein FliE